MCCHKRSLRMSSRSAPFLKARYSDNMYIRLLCRWHPLYCQEVPAMDRGRRTQTRPLSWIRFLNKSQSYNRPIIFALIQAETESSV